ncbi:MAG: class I SAM-dependent methyltransferase [Aphanocapsa lilacina HA4352-LM1]|jgi:SAM-dependent methyltransferase|nr:class I SAM-dependent methyltransferase [Aphanocapsa lilacina HA4352-LM1]
MDEQGQGRLRLPHEIDPKEAAFDSLSVKYDERYALTAVGCLQRRQVWERIAGLFPPGGRILELGCGTGLDAEYLAGLGMRVLATDIAPAMAAVAARRCRELPAVAVRVLAAEQIGTLEDTFDGVFSNFAALNCVLDLNAFAAALAARLRPGGAAALVLFGRLCWWEMAGYGLRGRWSEATRRLRPGVVRASIGSGREVAVRYYSPTQVRRAFSPWFCLEARAAVGCAVPPTYFDGFVRARPRLLALGQRVDRAVGGLWPFNQCGDHTLYVLRRR